jgi:hypothetical protein
LDKTHFDVTAPSTGKTQKQLLVPQLGFFDINSSHLSYSALPEIFNPIFFKRKINE